MAAPRPRCARRSRARAWRRSTPKTITTLARFEAELRRIRKSGYALDDEEQYLGLRCVAMPVFCYSGDVIASMCVVGPKERMTNRKITDVRVPLALGLSRRPSERLGAGPDADRTSTCKFGPPPPSGVTQTMFCRGSLMSQVLQWTQFCALICSRLPAAAVASTNS